MDYTLSRILIEGGVADMLGWILAGGMVIGVILGNGSMKSTYRKLLIALGIYLIIQEVTRVYYWKHIGYTSSLGPSMFTVIIAGTYLIGMGIGRVLIILGAARRARILSKYREVSNLNVGTENQVPHN